MTSKEQFKSSRARTRYCKQRVVSAIVLRNRCAAVKIIWQRHRGLRIRGVGSGKLLEETRCTCPTNGIGYTASTKKRARHPGKIGCSALIRKIEPSFKQQSSEQSLICRITKWNSESCFPTVQSSTSTPSAIRF